MWGRIPHGLPVPLPLPDAAGNAGTKVRLTEYDSLVVAVSFTLATVGAGPNRVPVVTLADQSGAALVPVAAPFTLGVGHNARFTLAVGLSQYGANDGAHIGAGLPPLLLGPLSTVAVTVDAGQAGDTLTGGFLYVQRFEPCDGDEG